MPEATCDLDRILVRRLRAGDEAAFMRIVDAWSSTMLGLAREFTPSAAVAEEVVQETWVAVLRGLDRFEGRSSLKTWVFRILVNRAKTRGIRERRTVPFAVFAGRDDAGQRSTVDVDRVLTEDASVSCHWGAPPTRREAQPAAAAESAETLELIREAIDGLPPAQRTVILLRDVQGWDGTQISDALAITPTNQRVLLHRARTTVRAALKDRLAPAA